MRKLSNRIIACMLCLMSMISLLSTPAFAADSIAVNQQTSLTIEYTHGHVPVPDVAFDLYYVASVDADGKFTLAGDFQKYPVTVDGLSTEGWKTLAETLAAYADRDLLKPLDSGKTDAQGELTFPNQQTNQKTGLYLVVGRKLVRDGYTYTTEPFLASLPNWDQQNSVWMYDVTATPKHTRTENPAEPSDRTVERRVLKIWKEDTQQSRPKEVTIQLLRDGVIFDTVQLNADNNWGHTWEKLPEYNEDGSKVAWTVTEEAPEDYTVLITREGITFTVTNTYSPREPSDDVITRTVLKVWEDKGYEKRRPKSIKVTLRKNGTIHDTQTLDEENGWMYTWKDLPKYDQDGKEIEWTIREVSVLGYVSSIRQNGETTVITNTLDKQKLPQTGVLWWPVPVLAAAGLAFLIVGVLSGKKKSHE